MAKSTPLGICKGTYTSMVMVTLRLDIAIQMNLNHWMPSDNGLVN